MVDGTKRNFYIPRAITERQEVPRKDRFDVLLKRIGRSQAWLADEVGISKASISRIAKGDWIPSTGVMVRICKILDVESCYLFGDSVAWRKWHDKMIYLKEDKQ